MRLSSLLHLPSDSGTRLAIIGILFAFWLLVGVDDSLAFQGKVQIVHTENPSQEQYFLKTKTNQFPLTGSRQKLASYLGKEVRTSDFKNFKVISTRRAKSLTHKTAIVLINFKDRAGSYDPKKLRSLMWGDANSVQSFYQAETEGMVSFTSASEEGDVLGPVEIERDPNKCQAFDWAKMARSQIGNTRYDHLVYILPSTSACSWAGLAWTPGNESWINGEPSVALLAHELGHNLGLAHASGLNCKAGIRVSISDNCTIDPYGDPYDVMGTSTHYHSYLHLAKLGVPQKLQEVNSSGTYSFKDTKLLKIKGLTDNYYLEMRSVRGEFDNFESGSLATNGLFIRKADELNEPGATKLIDTHPQTSSFRDAPLKLAETFEDPKLGLKIRLTSLGPNPTVQIALNREELQSEVANSQITSSYLKARKKGSKLKISAGAQGGVKALSLKVNGQELATSKTKRLQKLLSLKPKRSYRIKLVAKDLNGNLLIKEKTLKVS